ncbi:Alpha/beta hydrolase family protein [Solimonas aquatica]|uniref:Alpha/beta hydrolase family protein n=1 Tax=Solimonas aquatica TaxID=489703 RepID=A0A1H9CNN2_9GAMM|nr:alpha/beta hydrolase [Solimonas aquatica]SEQ02667.1 Alpha/beta hydrolase family protein [Solimonas aquatica]
MPLQDLNPPGKLLLLMESRILAERARFAWQSRRLLRELPAGQQQPLLIIPGFGCDDALLAAPRRLLCDLGYAAHGWGQGRNLGMRAGLKQALAARLDELAQRHGQSVLLLGWSLGGVFAREMARHQSTRVRRVITLGSPINGHPNANNMVLLFKLANGGGGVGPAELEGFARRIVAPPVPCTAVYSKSDGIVAWRASLEDPAPQCENLEVRGSHFGLPFNPQVLRIVCERLQA